MRFFPIPQFRPLETKDDASQQDRTVLRRADSVVAVPNGALGNGPCWRPLWGLVAVDAAIETALAGASATQAHFVSISRGAHTLLLVWSRLEEAALGIFDASGDGTDAQLDAASGVVVSAPADPLWRGKDGSAPWYLSLVDGEVWLGNGIDANLRWNGSWLETLGASVAPGGIYERSRHAIPPCTCFAVATTRQLLCGGNAQTPKRVWIVQQPVASEAIVRGLTNPDTDFVDLTLTSATRITGMSSWQNYVTIHTDKHPVNIFGIDLEGATGWKAQQQPSPANASAPNPACAADPRGSGPFYLGADGEIYKDEATRTGPYNKRVQMDVEIATAECSGEWNAAMVRPLSPAFSSMIFDTRTRLLWVATRLQVPLGTSGWWCYNDRNDSASGPFRYPDARRMGALRGYLTRTIALAMTSQGDLLYADLTAVAPEDPWETDPAGTPLGAAYAEQSSEPEASPSLSVVGMSADGKGYALLLSGGRIEMATPWEQWAETALLDLTRFFGNATLGIVETSYLDLGSGDVVKQFLEVRLKWRPQCRAHVGVFAESEHEHRSGKWYGSVYGREDVRMPISLLGQRIRVRLILVTFNEERAELREASIGYVPVGDR